jgi:SH3-like domain-containing protein
VHLIAFGAKSPSEQKGTDFMLPRSRHPGKALLQTLALALALALSLLDDSSAALAQQAQIGQVSKLPLPRFVSLKSDRVNLHEGPSKDHRTLWLYERAGLPVEITAEFEIWRKIRDSEGSEGWVLHSLLSGRRTGLVAPWKKEPQLLTSSDHATPVAKLAPGVIAMLKKCDGEWCRVQGPGFDGYMKQENLWGAYPGEKID